MTAFRDSSERRSVMGRLFRLLGDDGPTQSSNATSGPRDSPPLIPGSTAISDGGEDGVYSPSEESLHSRSSVSSTEDGPGQMSGDTIQGPYLPTYEEAILEGNGRRRRSRRRGSRVISMENGFQGSKIYLCE